MVNIDGRRAHPLFPLVGVQSDGETRELALPFCSLIKHEGSGNENGGTSGGFKGAKERARSEILKQASRSAHVLGLGSINNRLTAAHSVFVTRFATPVPLSTVLSSQQPQPRAEPSTRSQMERSKRKSVAPVRTYKT